MEPSRVESTTDEFTFNYGNLALDDLAAMSVEALEEVYATGRVPSTLAALDGRPVGRMLTLVGGLGEGVWRERVATFARSAGFPWGGKSFHSESAARGGGINRVHLAGRTMDWYPFDTFVGPSVLDGEPAVVLDYDKAENPFFIRAIHDEIREVAPGLYLGPAMAKVGPSPKLVLFFAIDTNQVGR